MADNGLYNAIIPSLNTILGIREQLAYKGRVYYVTRTYDAQGLTYTDTEVEITPVPNVYERSEIFKNRNFGSGEYGDIVVKSISKATYPDGTVLETKTDPAQPLVNHLYRFKESYYTCIKVKEKLFTWQLELLKYNGG